MNAEEIINYQYTRRVGTPYEQTLKSIREIRTEEANEAKAEQDLRELEDQHFTEIAILRECINEATNPTKQAICKRANGAGLSQRLAGELLKSFDGIVWASVRRGNAYLYKLC